MRDAIIASTSTLYGQDYLEYLLPILESRLQDRGVDSILFVPYARPGGITHEEYTSRASLAFARIGVEVNGIHEYDDQNLAIDQAKAIFVGGGNTFVLVKMLHDFGLMQTLRKNVLNDTFYLGTSAGSNICGLNMGTTNDMPITRPSSFQTMGIIPYNINAHFIEKEGDGNHMGESRATRIKEFHIYNHIPVVGLKEGSYIDVKDSDEILRGDQTALIFNPGLNAAQVNSGHNFNNLNR